MARWPTQLTRVQADRVYLRKCEKEMCWELVELQAEGERLLGKFYTGTANKPGNLAHMVLDLVRGTEKV